MLELAGYTNLVLIGEGGLGRVYRGVRISTGGTVAIKELHDVATATPVWHRAVREVEAMLRLKGHPYVVSVEEIAASPSGPCIVMEYLAGGSLHDRAQLGPLSIPETLLAGHHVAQALAAAHSLGVVHRDVKPHNLMIGGFGQVKVADFGIASILRDSGTRTQTQALTLAYASPEELDGAPNVGPPADVYSLAATLGHLVTGQKPSFRDRTPSVLPFAHDTGLQPLAAALRRAMAIDPAARPSMAELVTAFDTAIATLGSARVTALPVLPAPIHHLAAQGDATIIKPSRRADAHATPPATEIRARPPAVPPAEPSRRKPRIVLAIGAATALVAALAVVGVLAMSGSDDGTVANDSVAGTELVTLAPPGSDTLPTTLPAATTPVSETPATAAPSTASVPPGTVAPVPVTVTPTTPTFTGPAVSLNCNFCRLRSLPTTDSAVVAELTNSMGSPVEILGDAVDGWVEVRVDGRTGWLFGTFTWPVPLGFVLGEQTGAIELLDADGAPLGIDNPTGNKVLISELGGSLHTVLLPDGTTAYVAATMPTRR